VAITPLRRACPYRRLRSRTAQPERLHAARGRWHVGV